MITDGTNAELWRSSPLYRELLLRPVDGTGTDHAHGGTGMRGP